MKTKNSGNYRQECKIRRNPIKSEKSCEKVFDEAGTLRSLKLISSNFPQISYELRFGSPGFS